MGQVYGEGKYLVTGWKCSARPEPRPTSQPGPWPATGNTFTEQMSRLSIRNLIEIQDFVVIFAKLSPRLVRQPDPCYSTQILY